MNLKEILKNAGLEGELEDLLSGVSDDSLHRITLNVLDAANRRIEELEAIRASMHIGTDRLRTQRDKAHVECAQLRADLANEKGFADVLETERDELRAVLDRREHHLGAVRRTKADLDLCKQTLDVLRQEYDKLVIERVKKQADLSAAKSTISTLRSEYKSQGEELVDKDAMLDRVGRDRDSMHSRLADATKRYDKHFEHARSIGSRLATELKNDPSTSCWLSILGLGYSTDVDMAIWEKRKITVINLVRDAAGCGLIEAKWAVEARMDWLDKQKETQAQEQAEFLLTGKALDIVWQMANMLQGESLPERPDLTPELQRLALGTVEDFIANSFEED